MLEQIFYIAALHNDPPDFPLHLIRTIWYLSNLPDFFICSWSELWAHYSNEMCLCSIKETVFSYINWIFVLTLFGAKCEKEWQSWDGTLSHLYCTFHHNYSDQISSSDNEKRQPYCNYKRKCPVQWRESLDTLMNNSANHPEWHLKEFQNSSFSSIMWKYFSS